jgi:hypothetical protein
MYHKLNRIEITHRQCVRTGLTRTEIDLIKTTLILL